MLLFLGSGVSIPSGLPSVEVVTERILGSAPPCRDLGREGFNSTDLDALLDINEQKCIYAFLQLLAKLDSECRHFMSAYWSGKAYKWTGSIYRKATTYEDLYYLCEQIYWNGQGLVDEAPATAFVNLVEQQAHELLSGATREARLMDLYGLARKASRLIESTVEESLKCQIPVCLDVIAGLALEDIHLNILTLNHDTLVEQVLRKHQLPFFDGFGDADGDVRWWKGSSADSDCARTQLVKLHGSIDWRRFSVDGKAAIGKVDRIESDSWRLGSGRTITPSINGAYVLSGINKIVSYNGGVFADMFYRFHRALVESNTMIMSGYGWGDLGINIRIEAWLDESAHHKLILLHKEPELLLNRSPQLDRSYEHWTRLGKVLSVRSWLGEVSSYELIELAGTP